MAKLRIASIGKCLPSAAVRSDAVPSVIPGKLVSDTLPESRSQAKPREKPKELGACVVHDLSSQEAAQPSSLETTENAPSEPDTLSKLSAEGFPKPGQEAPPIDEVDAASPESAWNGEIRIDKQDRVDFLSATRSRPKRYLTATVIGSVVLSGLSLGLGWFTQSTHFFAATTPNKPVSSRCAVDSEQGKNCAAQNSGRLDNPAPTRNAAKDANSISLPTRQATPSVRTAVSLPTKQNVLPVPTAVVPAKLSAAPVAVPETGPPTIKGWMVRNVIGRTAVLEGPNGIRNVRRGDEVSGLGKIEDIMRWGKWWIVATERGLISTQ